MSLNFQALQIDVRRLTKWDVALWVRSRVNNGAKTAGSTAKTALALAERCTDEVFHANSSLVKAQAAPAHEARASADPPKPAAPLKWAHLEGLEAAILYGKTAQQRILHGFFTSDAAFLKFECRQLRKTLARRCILEFQVGRTKVTV